MFTHSTKSILGSIFQELSDVKYTKFRKYQKFPPYQPVQTVQTDTLRCYLADALSPI